MIPIESTIEDKQTQFASLSDQLEQEDFHLGGGYTYDHGYFDKPLDWEEEHGNRYFLRIPVFGVQGDIGDPDTLVRIGKPFVIKHEFRTDESRDPAGDSGVFSGMMNQFTTPIPAEDHPIDQKWIDRAKEIVHRVEELPL
ncbi:YugN-like family protein [Shimazuella sp. AN120528]|uniref:YugN family protein n=1 Tax=Shimazuella soli TaxID=1892854 RepID=UPI001F0E11A5|nr:YugN family protein [Shimazuella soli]MCH5583456.1 YugN-like family protein [Shimazuella soli]